MSVCHPTKTFSCKRLLFPLPIAFALIYNVPKFFEIVKCTKLEMCFTMLRDLSSIEEKQAVVKNESELQIITNCTLMTNTNNNVTLDRTLGDLVANCDIYGNRVTSLRNNRWYIILYVFLSELILVEVVPWVTVIILNVSIWKGIRSFRKRRQSLGNKLNNAKGKNPQYFKNI